MKAVAVVPSKREVLLVDHPEPILAAPDEVKFRLLQVGCCGTDREIAGFHFGTPPVGSDHLVIGHEALGEVVEVGDKVDSVKPGDLVVPTVRRPCPHSTCRAFLHERQDFCFTGDFTERGIKEAHGFMTEVVVERERYLHPVPGGMREIGVLVEPLTIAEKALVQVWDVQERLPWSIASTHGRGRKGGCNAVILGAGPVGLLGAMALAVRGFEIFVYSLESDDTPNAEVTREIGGTYVNAKTNSLDQLAEQVGNIDLVYEATGAAQVSFELLERLGTNGIYVLTGVPGRKGPIRVNADLIMRNLVLKNQLVFGTVNAGPEAFSNAIADLERFGSRWPVPLKSLITGRHPVDAYRDVLIDNPGGIKNVINFSRGI